MTCNDTITNSLESGAIKGMQKDICSVYFRSLPHYLQCRPQYFSERI